MALTFAVRLPAVIFFERQNITTCKTIGVLSCGFSVSKLLKNLQQALACLHPVDQPEKNIPDMIHFFLLPVPGVNISTSSPVPWYWWSQAGSNRRPPACKAGALPAELWPRFNLSIFRYAAPCFLSRSVMYLMYTPSLFRLTACLTKNGRR